MRPPTLRLLDDEIIIDCFAGGGGASLGIEEALGRKVTIAINHDAEAITMHKANHPETEHYIEDLYDVNPTAVVKGRPVGLAWFSPDCTEHSKAKNGSIVRSKKIRGLAWVVIDWARLVAPRVILLENVEEWWNWGPLNDEGQIDKARKGEHRAFWWQRLEALGYRLSMRILKACDYGAPTSRKRLFIIARNDGVDPETCWPEATHGPGREQPYRTAAECIDYSLPCPSIFMTRRQARAFTKRTGIRCKRPLVDKTMKRIRRGLFKYVINCAKPFTIRLTGDDDRVYDIDQPMRTVTAAPRGEFGFVQPYLARYNGQSVGQPCSEPLGTLDCTDRYSLVAPTLIQTGYGERPGQAPRCLDLQAPLGTVISGGGGNGNGKHAIVQSRLERVSAWLYKGYGDDSAKRTGGFAGGASLEKPLSTITCADHSGLAVSHMVKLRGTSDAHMDASSGSATDPIPTISANGNHHGEVRAFLSKYHGDKGEPDGRGSDLRLPVPTIDTSNRFGLVMVDGEAYEIVDIGMRMLEPRELYRAQGFPDSYIIDPVVETKTVLKNGRVKTKAAPLSKTAQVEKCGNSVCPPIARAIAGSVFGAAAQVVRAA